MNVTRERYRIVLVRALPESLRHLCSCTSTTTHPEGEDTGTHE